jgi:hypothetical protein
VNLADVAPPATTAFAPVAVLCGGLVCLFLVSAVLLAVVLYRRSRRQPPADVS